MKKLFWLLAIVLIGVYGSGYAGLGEGGAIRFLNRWEELSVDGDAEAVCDLMHEDLQVSLDDRSGGRPVQLQGGKEEFCAYARQAISAMKLVMSSMNVTRENIEVKREWLHPWTADLSYTERRALSMAGGAVQMSVIGEDRLTLVKTFGGVKIRRLQSTTRRGQGE